MLGAATDTCVKEEEAEAEVAEVEIIDSGILKNEEVLEVVLPVGAAESQVGLGLFEVRGSGNWDSCRWIVNRFSPCFRLFSLKWSFSSSSSLSEVRSVSETDPQLDDEPLREGHGVSAGVVWPDVNGELRARAE